ncbi:hypothetical protein [Pseudoalteromonas umbrosa]|uniref:hypothetical protein n=1 Tax=Pseudoalteromonas umbrosa TaxID=3048489 RepID=UPI0024C3FDAE|nr:hypothetical protein [Pseudoalteromonas sp. B95]MDK1286639.1 hypothetical protein [Pseudoalteromonas sp. B95]
MSNFDKWFVKALVILALLLFFMPMFFLLNFLSSDSMWVFIAVIFGCNIVYDATKKIVSSQIYSAKEWISVLKFSWAGLVLIAVSFSGIYIDIFVFKYVGIGLIWFPCFFFGMLFMGKAQQSFKLAEKSTQ